MFLFSEEKESMVAMSISMVYSVYSLYEIIKTAGNVFLNTWGPLQMVFQLYCKLIASVDVWIKKKLNSPLSLGLSDWLAGGTHLLQVLIGQYEFLLVF